MGRPGSTFFSWQLFLLALLILGARSASYAQEGKYLGAFACKKCHFRPYETWSKTAHAKDFSDFNYHGTKINLYTFAEGSCTSCHVLAYGEPDGYDPNQAWDHQARFLRVQCENCHGPGRTHAAATISPSRLATVKRLPDARLTCLRCHVSHYLQQPSGPATDEDLDNLPRRQSAMLYGMQGFHYPGVTYKSSMHKAVVQGSCVTCHMHPANRHDLKADLEACQGCHGGITDFDVNSRQTEISAMLRALKGRLEAFQRKHGRLQLAPEAREEVLIWDSEENKLAYKRAWYNYNFVESDGSRGVHNYKYAKGLLDSSLDRLPME